MKFLVLGAGMMGSAAAYDLAKSDPANEVVLADINLQTANRSASAIGPNVKAVRLDVNSARDLVGAMRGCAAVISAVSYSVNVHVTRAALEAGVHVCDLGGNNEVVAKQLALNSEAAAKGVTIIPNSGLAPGLINVLAVTGSRTFDALDSIRLRVGGLPQHPRPPLNYQIVFSVEGLINEYVEQAAVIQDGELRRIDPMSGLEEIRFREPFGTLEAFSTSGGLSTMTELFAGKVRNLDYKTIRYRGHCEKMKTLLDLGFATTEPMMVGGSVKTNREFFADLLRKKLDFGDKDVVLARATITGTRDGAERSIAYEFIDFFDDAANMTAMMRATAFPTSIIAQMLSDGTISARGVMPPEACVDGDLMITALGRRNLRITKRITETWS
ncbi:MAG TPA: saccharopine dehydrogenase C-terminal domain-containing protein [Bacteroidota bacterium]|nr:saccharopine dehydrogenase C-terminal domain-containing protein [Bacteroidota bacterium]